MLAFVLLAVTSGYMLLDAFIAETMEGLAKDSEEVVVAAVSGFRTNPGPGEYGVFNGSNTEMIANPIPA